MIIITSVTAVMTTPSDETKIIEISHWDVEFETYNANVNATLTGTLKWYETAFHPGRVFEVLEREFGQGGG